MPYPKRLLTEGEEIVTEFRPHWRLLLIPVLWTVAGITGIILALIYGNDTFGLVISGVVVVALVPIAVVPFVRWWFTMYVLTTERLITRSGVIARKGIEIPVENISNVLFSQTVMERILKSGDLLIESPGESGQSRFSDVPDPDEFQSLLYRVREARTKAFAREEGAMVAEAVVADPTERLERLARLHREGVITDAEFDEKRRRILDEI